MLTSFIRLSNKCYPTVLLRISFVIFGDLKYKNISVLHNRLVIFNRSLVFSRSIWLYVRLLTHKYHRTQNNLVIQFKMESLYLHWCIKKFKLISFFSESSPLSSLDIDQSTSNIYYTTGKEVKVYSAKYATKRSLITNILNPNHITIFPSQG